MIDMDRRRLNGKEHSNAERHMMSTRRVSLEREFSLWRQGRPLSRAEAGRFKDRVEARKDDMGISCLDSEVAVNSLEAKFSLIEKKSCALHLRRLRRGVEQLAGEEGVKICWTNQPPHSAVVYNEYFTTIVFPRTVNSMIHTNSLHMHLEVEPENAVHAYKEMNLLAPSIIRESTARGGGYERNSMIADLVMELGEMFLPQDIMSMDDYSRYMERMSVETERRMQREGTLVKAIVQYPHMFPDGRLRLTPDKIFHPARLRPDLELPNGNISLEFRAIDGVGNVADEIRIAERVINAFDQIVEGKGSDTSIETARTYLANSNVHAFSVGVPLQEEGLKNAAIGR